MKKILLSLMAMVCAMTASADTQTLQPTGVFTWTNAPAITYDASATSWKINQGAISGGKLGKYAGPYAIVKFDASEILEGKTLISAKLNFTIPKASYNTSLNIAQMADATFDPATVTTETFNATATQFQDGDWSSKSVDTNFSYDVTARVEDSKVIAFAIYCNTGREQTLKNVALEVEYSSGPVNKFQYSLTAVDASLNTLKELASGEEFEGKTVTVYFPMTFAKDGKLYTTTETPFNVSFYKDNTIKTVTYAESSSDIVAFVEGEAGAVNSKDNGAYSDGKTGHAAGGKSVTIATLPAGKYKAVMKFEANGNRGIYLRNTDVSDVNENVVVVMPIDKNSKAGEFTSDEFTLTKETTIGFTGYTSNTTTNQSADIDYIYILKTGDVLNTIAAGKYTLTADVALAEGVTEAMVPADFKKYIGTYTSNATLAGDEKSLTISENDEAGLFTGFEIKGDAVALAATKTITLNGKVFNIRTAADAENGSLAITAEGDNYKMDAANVWYNGKKVATITNIVIAKAAVAPVVAIEKGEGTITVTSTSETAALYYLCKPMSWLDEGETPESALLAEIEGMGMMIDSEETWELYDHMGMKPAPKTFTIADYQEMYGGEEMFIIAANVGWNGEKLAVISNIVEETFTVPAAAPVVAIEKGEGTYTVTSTSETAALYYLCKDVDWLDDGETPESVLLAEIEGMGMMIDSEETWELYDHMGMKPAPKTFTIADYQDTYAGKEMFIIAANVGWNGEKLGVISNIAIENFTVPGTTGIKNVTATKAANAKFIENGKLVIISNGKKFNAAGVEMK